MAITFRPRLLARCANSTDATPLWTDSSRKGGSLKLHLGCFDQIIPGWINTDITPHIFVSRIPGLAFLLYKVGFLSQQRYEQHKENIFRNAFYLNVVKRFPFDNCTFDHVFCSHLLEHLHPRDCICCIKEVFRVLKPAGIFRVVVPDLDKIVQEYDSYRSEEFCERIFEAKQRRDKNRHHWHYNEISLGNILHEVGFHEVRRCGFRQGWCADVEAIDNRPGSLFMEAKK